MMLYRLLGSFVRCHQKNNCWLRIKYFRNLTIPSRGTMYRRVAARVEQPVVDKVGLQPRVAPQSKDLATKDGLLSTRRALGADPVV